jgi:hypothetical protein
MHRNDHEEALGNALKQIDEAIRTGIERGFGEVTVRVEKIQGGKIAITMTGGRSYRHVIPPKA